MHDRVADRDRSPLGIERLTFGCRRDDDLPVVWVKSGRDLIFEAQLNGDDVNCDQGFTFQRFQTSVRVLEQLAGSGFVELVGQVVQVVFGSDVGLPWASGQQTVRYTRKSPTDVTATRRRGPPTNSGARAIARSLTSTTVTEVPATKPPARVVPRDGHGQML